MGRIILASTSPRRAELVKRIGLTQCKIVDPRVEEKLLSDMPPEELVGHWSRRKAEAVSASPEDVVIAADTIVWFDGGALGKPSDAADAFGMLTMLAGNWHTVYTGLTVIHDGQTITEVESTAVLMRPMSTQEIEAYVATGEPLDKAGAYGVQERGALLCERVDGDFYNVMGLPLFRLGRVLADLGVNLFEEEE